MKSSNLRLFALLGGFALLPALAGCGAKESSADNSGSAIPKDQITEAVDAAPVDAAPKQSTPKKAAPDVVEGSYQKAPDFELASIDGGALKLSDLHGKVVLLDFWATWCGPCVRGIPHLNELHQTHHEEGLEIVGISVDRPRPGSPQTGADIVKAFAQKTPMDYRLVMADAATAHAYGGIRSIPTAFLIDRDGNIRQRYVGLQPGHVFERDIKELLAEGNAAAGDESI